MIFGSTGQSVCQFIVQLIVIGFLCELHLTIHYIFGPFVFFSFLRVHGFWVSVLFGFSVLPFKYSWLYIGLWVFCSSLSFLAFTEEEKVERKKKKNYKRRRRRSKGKKKK